MPAAEPGLELADLLRQLRDTRGWTQTDLANLLGTTDQTVSRWENGSLPQPRYRRRIEALLTKSQQGEDGGIVVQFPTAPRDPAAGFELSAEQTRLIGDVSSRLASGVPLTESEAKIIRSLMSALGLRWLEG